MSNKKKTLVKSIEKLSTQFNGYRSAHVLVKPKKCLQIITALGLKTRATTIELLSWLWLGSMVGAAIAAELPAQKTTLFSLQS